MSSSRREIRINSRFSFGIRRNGSLEEAASTEELNRCGARGGDASRNVKPLRAAVWPLGEKGNVSWLDFPATLILNFRLRMGT